jgi:hypothetical protein
LLIICLIAVLVMIGGFVNAAPGGSSKGLRLTDANGSWGFIGFLLPAGQSMAG